MAKAPRPSGGVVVRDEQYEVIALLLHPLRRTVDLKYYAHPTEVNPETAHDFIAVLSVDDLQNVIRHYDTKQQPVPLLIHIDDPQTLADFDPARMYPGLEIMSVARANLADGVPDVTLNVSLAGQILKRLKGH